MAKLSSQSTLPTQFEKVGGKFCSEIERVCFLTQIEPEITNWLFELQDKRRLNTALKAFKAIDQQMKIGADVRDARARELVENRMRSVLKSVSFRSIATLMTMVLVLIFTRDIAVSFEIGAIEFFGKFVLYYFHERLWNMFHLGRN